MKKVFASVIKIIPGVFDFFSIFQMSEMWAPWLPEGGFPFYKS